MLLIKKEERLEIKKSNIKEKKVNTALSTKKATKKKGKIGEKTISVKKILSDSRKRPRNRSRKKESFQMREISINLVYNSYN